MTKTKHAGKKYDEGKPKAWAFVANFPLALQKVAELDTIGALKYTPSGWREVPNGQERYMDAFMRHALKLAAGEELDDETGMPHKASMIWNLLAVLEMEIEEGHYD